ncbi:MAG: penicillin-binding protein 1C [Bacteroidales bacterium]
MYFKIINSLKAIISNRKKKRVAAIAAILLALVISFFAIKEPAFTDPTSTVLVSKDNTLLAATIASDEQYRFPPSLDIPQKFTRCIVEFEDRYFFQHPGINPFSIVRAAWNNMKAKRVVQGGSTITMQVIRLYRKGEERSLFEKIIEAILALRLEATSSKNKILSMYSSNAPFGGNVVGLNAAAWRYYGRSPHELSWAETASLAVLPNSPAMVHPGRNPEVLREKRDKLLGRLHKNGTIDSITYSLSLHEPLPSKPRPLPSLTPHLLTRTSAEGKAGQLISTTIDPHLQQQVNGVLEHHHSRLSGNQIHNGAILILDIETNSALAYVGNTSGKNNGNQVDIITSPRSTGSILKPFLYAAMLHDGSILPRTLVADIPTQIGGYSPKNFHPEYDGAVPASRAISRSLNVPAVRMLQQYGVEKFHFILNKLGLTTITRDPDDFGLSLILGGAEATLWDLAGVYASMARTLNNYRSFQSRYNSNNYSPPSFTPKEIEEPVLKEHSTLNASAIYFAFEAMKEVARPDELAGWQYFSSSRSVAWKTGTSYGHRDAWAIGLNPKYVVAVWVGNASGEGRPNLTGISAAAPVLFDVFSLLPTSSWFERPIDDMARVPICRHSGHRALEDCTPVDTMWIPLKGLETAPCPYHISIHLNKEKTHRVTDKCLSVDDMVKESWFVLPPAMEWFYKSKNPFYRQLPPYKEGCQPETSANPMQLIYPRIEQAEIFIPRDLDGNLTEVIFEVAHRNDNATIYWHLNEEYMGLTQSFHKLALRPNEGSHKLTLVDNYGNSVQTQFKVIER